MSTPIRNNTEGLRAILNAVNALPEASGGGSSGGEGIFATLKKKPIPQVILTQIANYLGDVEMEVNEL